MINFLWSFCKIIVLCCVYLIQYSLQAQLTLKADHTQAIYEAGDAMNFLLKSSESGEASYVIRYDRYTAPVASGTIDLIANEEVMIPFSLPEAGVVLCWVNQNGNTATGGAVFSPFDIQPFESDPIDAISFWETLKDSLAIIPIDPQLTFEEDGDYSTTYRINLANIDGRRVYGYLSVPDGDGPFPAVLELPPFGSSANVVTPNDATAERVGVLSMTISIHNAEPDEVDTNAYQPDIIDSAALNYYRYAILGAIRSIDYLVSRNDYDGDNLAVMGVSQGGGLSLLVSGLDERVKIVANSNPALCEHTGYKYDRASGFPYYLRKSDNEIGTPEHFAATLAATKYFDAVRYAKYFEGPSLTLIGYRDTVCPPAGSYAAFNQLPGPKILVQAKEVGHNHPEEYQSGRFDLFRRYFSGTQNPPWPWPDTTIGYFIQATADSLQIHVGDSVQLTGLVDLNGETSGSWTTNWRMIEGPGTATFTNTSTLNPMVYFDSIGTYRLEFRAVDSALALPDRFFTLIDYVTIEAYMDIDTMVVDTMTIDTMTANTIPFKVIDDLSISPNPSSGIFNLIAHDRSMQEITVFDVQGKLIFNEKLIRKSSSYRLDLRKWPSGRYYVHVLLNSKSVICQVVKLE